MHGVSGSFLRTLYDNDNSLALAAFSGYLCLLIIIYRRASVPKPPGGKSAKPAETDDSRTVAPINGSGPGHPGPGDLGFRRV